MFWPLDCDEDLTGKGSGLSHIQLSEGPDTVLSNLGLDPVYVTFKEEEGEMEQRRTVRREGVGRMQPWTNECLELARVRGGQRVLLLGLQWECHLLSP